MTHAFAIVAEDFDPATFVSRLGASELKAPVQRTLRFMLDWSNSDGWSCISQARIAEATGLTGRTIRNHWNAAKRAGYLRSFDYPLIHRRTSDHWLTWPGRGMSSGCPGLDAAIAPTLAVGYWESFEGPMIDSPGPPPF